MNFFRISDKRHINLDFVRAITRFENPPTAERTYSRYTVRFIQHGANVYNQDYADIDFDNKEKADALYQRLLKAIGEQPEDHFGSTWKIE